MNINPIEYLFKVASIQQIKFMSIRNYVNREGEMSDYTLIAAFDYDRAVKKDIKRLESVRYEGLKEIARQELLQSLVNNQSDETRNAQSQAQIDAYAKIGANSRVHLETMSIKVWAFLRKKTVLIPTEYRKVNHQAKTVCKNQIKKELKLSTSNFRQFTLTNITESVIKGETLEIAI